MKGYFFSTNASLVWFGWADGTGCACAGGYQKRLLLVAKDRVGIFLSPLAASLLHGTLLTCAPPFGSQPAAWGAVDMRTGFHSDTGETSGGERQWGPPFEPMGSQLAAWVVVAEALSCAKGGVCATFTV